MQIAEALKREMRHSWLSDGRRESVAEHSWAMSLLAMVLFNESSEKVDQLKVLKMIILHDLVEAIAGDIPSHEQTNENIVLQKAQNERKALETILGKIENKETAKEFELVWEEFENKATPESKFAQACDKIEAIIQHNMAPISSFSQGDYDINPYYKDSYFDFDNIFRELKDFVNIQTMLKFESEGDISRIKPEHREKWENHKQNSA